MVDFDEQALWALIRVWCGAASAALAQGGECSSFDYTWQEICRALARGYMRKRLLTNDESVVVWNALIEAQYPGWERVQPIFVDMSRW